jgi:hypothetical protein
VGSERRNLLEELLAVRFPLDPLQELLKEWGFGSATAGDERIYLRFGDTILEGSHPIVSHPPSLSPPKKEAYHD